MRSLVLIGFFFLLFPLFPITAGDPAVVTPSTEIEPGKEVPDWEARFQKREEKKEDKEQRREVRKERKRDEADEKREQKKEQRREMRKDHREHR